MRYVIALLVIACITACADPPGPIDGDHRDAIRAAKTACQLCGHKHDGKRWYVDPLFEAGCAQARQSEPEDVTCRFYWAYAIDFCDACERNRRTCVDLLEDLAPSNKTRESEKAATE